MLKPLLAAVLLLVPAAVQAKAEPGAACPAFETTGTGPDVLLVPGLASSPQVWDGTAAALGDRYRFHLVTVPGFAGTPVEPREQSVPAALADRIARYVTCRRLDRPALVGHSMGGFTGLLVARDHPGMLSRVVTVDSLPFYPLLFDPQATVAAARPQAVAMADAIRGMDDATFAQMQRSGAQALTRSEEGRAAIVAWSTASDRTTFADAIQTLASTDLRPDLGRIATPVTVIHATNAYAPAARMDPLYRTAYADLPEVDFATVEDSFHFVMWDQPDAFTAALATALGSGADR